MIKNIMIAFLIGLLVGNLAWGLKVPELILPEETDPNLLEVIQTLVDIANNGKYELKNNTTEVTADSVVPAFVLEFDTSGATKKLTISDGDNIYAVNLTAL